MAGRFEGLSDIEWKLFEDIFPQQPEKRGKGMPHTPFRYGDPTANGRKTTLVV